MNKIIYWDMDGTLNHFYKGTWLEDILARNPRPYTEADCVICEEVLLALQKRGYKLGIVSWLAKNSTKEYDRAVRKAKKLWLRTHYPNIKFDEIHIVKYGTPKWKVVKHRDGILFDDEERNRSAWRGQAYEPAHALSF